MTSAPPTASTIAERTGSFAGALGGAGGAAATGAGTVVGGLDVAISTTAAGVLLIAGANEIVAGAWDSVGEDLAVGCCVGEGVGRVVGRGVEGAGVGGGADECVGVGVDTAITVTEPIIEG